MMEDKFVILDFETTGCDIYNTPPKEMGYFKSKTWYDPIELALIDLSSEKEYHYFIEPHKDFIVEGKNWATEIHGYEPDSFMKRNDLQKWTDVFPEVQRVLTGKTAVAHNAFAFDKLVMEQTCEKYKLMPPLCKWRDTKKEIKQMYPDKPSSQVDVAKWLLEETYEAHSAIEDVRMLAKIFKNINQKPDWIFI